MAIAKADMPADAPVADQGDWAGAIRQRRKALLQRLGMASASALIFSPLLGWSLSFAWVIGYFIVQLLDLWVFAPIVSGKETAVPRGNCLRDVFEIANRRFDVSTSRRRGAFRYADAVSTVVRCANAGVAIQMQTTYASSFI